MSRNPLSPPWWHVRFWFYYWNAGRKLDKATLEHCVYGCCTRWVSPSGEDMGGVNPFGVDHWEETDE